MKQRYIKITSWEEFQHYKDRDPPWIKNYTRLLSDPAYLGLSGPQRAVLHGLWLMYAKSSRNVPENTASLSRMLSMRVTTKTLDALNHAGWITFVASKPLAPRYQRASPETETETYKSIYGVRRSKTSNGKGDGWVENLSSYTGCRYIRGEHALTAVYDPLGTERPPADWPHSRPKPAEIKRALKERANA